jgi:hypothetical protein
MPIVLPKITPGLGSGDPDQALVGSGESMPPGLEAILEYEGLYLGDTHVVDKIRVNEIAGLDDADVRDSREANPAAHGETPFDAYYGGRTLVITGRIEAYSLQKLRDIQQALRQAFSELEEKPLIFRTGNWDRDVMIWCRKINPIQMREIQQNFNYYRDFQVTVRASNPRFLSFRQLASEKLFSFTDTFDTNTLSNYRFS